MADVPGKFFKATKVRTGVSPSSPGVIEGETLPPVNPPGGSLNSVGLSMPSAFNVANSPLTSNGTLAVTGAGTVGQYIRGDGSLADFPQASGGGSSVSYYLNGSVDQGTIGGVAYRELSKVPILGAGTDFTINADGYIASFITDAGDPNLLEIPGGNWNFETYFSASSSGGTPTFYVELYKVSSGGTATLIASSSSAPELIPFGTNLTPYYSTLAVPTTTLALTDRLAIRYYVTHSGRTITLHTENNHLCQIVTTFTTGITALNGLTAQVQNFAVGTSGTDFNIASATATHTFNLPTASATNRGALSSADWSLFRQAYNDKINSASVTGTTTKTLTLVQQDGGEIQASWSDLNTDAVTSVFGRTGAVVAVSGDYNTSQVTESGNLYFTQARVSANTDVAANTAARHNAVTLGTANGLSLSTQQLSLGLASGSTTGALSSTDWNTFNNKENAITAGTTAQYFRGDKTFQTLNTAAVPESGNLYFTNARAIASTLTGYVSGAGTISSGDSILTAIQKLNGNIGALVTGVSSVNGQTGAVTLTTTNIGEGTNLYFTNTRARAALSFAAGSGAYNTTTGVITIPTDNNQIANGANYITAAALSAYLPLAGGTMTGAITTPNGTFGIVIGDDSRLADRNVANTLFLEGNQNTDRGYINFSQTSGNALGSVNGGDLTWRGNVVLHAANFNSYAPTLGGTGATGTWSIAITGNAGTANTWTTARTITIGNTGKSVNGSANVAWSLAEIGAYAATNPSAFIALTALSGVAPIQYNNTTGAISITQASGSQNGFLSSTDWTTFNNKQNALTNPVTGTGTTNYLPKFTGTSTIGNSNLINDASGNLGLGVTPSAWGAFKPSLQVGTASISQIANRAYFTANAFFNGTSWTYIDSDFATQYFQQNGTHIWNTVASGTAGNAISFTQAMTLNASGNLGLGVIPSAWATTFPSFKAIEVGFAGNALWSAGAVDFTMTSNAFFDGSWKYAVTANATRYQQADGIHRWHIAPSGTAGNAISFTQAMTLTSGGNLILTTGTVSDNGARLQVNGGNLTVQGNTNLGNSLGSTLSSTFTTRLSGFALRFDASNRYGNYGVLILNSDNAWTSGARRFMITNGIGANKFGIIRSVDANTDPALGDAGSIASGTVDFEINNAGAATFSSSVTSQGGIFTAQPSTGTNGTYSAYLNDGGQFYVGIDNSAGSLFGKGAYAYNFFSNANRPMVFSTDGTTRLTITGSGNIGIGTPGPSQLLHLYTNLATSSGVGTAMQITSDGAGGDNAWIGVNKGSGNGLEFSVENRDIIFNTGATTPFGGTERMRITSGGNVLIGSPPAADNGARFQVSGTGTFAGVGFGSNGIQTSGANGGNGIYSVAGGSAGSGVYGFTNDLSSFAGTFQHTGAGAGIALRVIGWSTFSQAATFSSNVTTTGGFLQFPNNYGVEGRNAANTAHRTVLKLNTSNQIEIGRDTDISSIILGTASAVNALTIASTGAATFSSTIRSNNTYGLGIGDIAGYRRIQYDLANTRFGLLTDGNALANLEAAAATFSSSVTVGEDINLSRASSPAIVSTTNQAIRLVTNGFTAQLRTDGVFANSQGFRTDGFIQAVNLAIGSSFYNSTPPTNGAIIQGNVLIGTTTDNGNRLRVNGNAWFDGNILMDSAANRFVGFGTGSENPYLMFSSNGSIILNVETNDTYNFFRGGSSMVSFTGSGIETIIGGLRTAAPTGTSNDFWRLGRALLATSSTPEDRWIRVQISNRIYDILAIDRGLA